MKQSSTLRPRKTASPKSAAKKPSPARKRLRRGEAEARIPAILDAALIEFGDKGFAAARMDDIAARVGVSKPIIYRHFKTKEDLYRAMMSASFLNPYDDVKAILTTYSGQLRPLLFGFIAEAKRQVRMPMNIRTLSVVLSMPEKSENVREVVDAQLEPVRRELARVFQRAMDRGEMRKCDSDIAAKHFSAPIFHCVLRILALGPSQWTDWKMEKYLDGCLEGFLHGYDIQ